MPLSDPLFLGIDGGGTGCRARIETADGMVLGQGLAGPATTRFGIDASWTAILTAAQGAIAEARLAAGEIGRVAAAAGVAGLGRKGARAELEARPHPFAAIAFATDGLIACLGAHGGKDGGIVICGTICASAAMASRSRMRAAAPISACARCSSRCAPMTGAMRRAR
jgi:glucosamine kinase